MHALAAFVYRQDDTCSASSFREQRAQTEEGGRYKGEYDKYLWHDKVFYKGIGVENSENKSVSENV